MTQAADQSLVDTVNAALARGDADLIALIDAALLRAPDSLALLLADSEARFRLGLPEPLARLDAALARHPGWIEGQRQRAALAWEGGAGSAAWDGFRRALVAQPQNAGLWNAFIGVLAAAGEQKGAADAARDARRWFDVPVLRLIEASHAGLSGDADRADALLETVPGDVPDRHQVAVRQSIRRGRLEQAEQELARWRDQASGDMSAWALTDLVWRLTGDRRATWLSGAESLIGVSQVEADPAEWDALATIVRRLHHPRAAPLGQSVRGGTQTRGALFSRVEPAIGALRDALQRAVDAHVAQLPGLDPDHPLLRHRNHRFRVQGGWSVRLTGGGFHVPHLHPGGLLSSACYLVLPQLHDPGEGALELGSAPPDLGVQLAPIRTIAPKTGQLVLFPSFLYHGTRPFDAGERMSVAFDAV